jgi:predicted unusual protein kinase regulating ubiquinone biosynthesis (AarF/ABC1/UbiB family)
VYKARLRASLGGADVAIKVQRPGIEPVIYRDLWLLRSLAFLVNPLSVKRLGCDAVTVIDEFGEKLLEELDYEQEARNMADFGANFAGDSSVKIPVAFPALSSGRLLTMEWIDGIRCTDPAGIAAAGIDVQQFIRVGVVSGMRQLLEYGLFHGDPHPVRWSRGACAPPCAHPLCRATSLRCGMGESRTWTLATWRSWGSATKRCWWTQWCMQ